MMMICLFPRFSQYVVCPQYYFSLESLSSIRHTSGDSASFDFKYLPTFEPNTEIFITVYRLDGDFDSDF